MTHHNRGHKVHGIHWTSRIFPFPKENQLTIIHRYGLNQTCRKKETTTTLLKSELQNMQAASGFNIQKLTVY